MPHEIQYRFNGRKNAYGEYVIQAYDRLTGKHNQDCSYYTDSLDDAKDTIAAMTKQGYTVVWTK